jgi:hypothetical protein
MRKFLIAAIAVTGMAFSGASLRAEDEKKDAKGWHGVLIDKACGSKQKDEKSAADHPKACAMKEGCAKSGYGLFVKDKWIKFDDKCNELAAAYLKEEEHGTKVHVTGELSKDGKEITVKEIHPDKEKKDDAKEGEKKE